MTYAIEKGIPLLRRPPHNTSYPFREMLVGDSFAVPLAEGAEGDRLRRRVATAANNFATRNPAWILRTHELVEEGRRVVRVWRVIPAVSKAAKSFEMDAPRVKYVRGGRY